MSHGVDPPLQFRCECRIRAIARIRYSHSERSKMARKPLTRPRKHASQDRSRATVDALIEATARILVREGFDSASTNRIAEQAGVSVGSLYQYFPGKEALVAAVIERHNRELMRVARGTLAKARGAAQAGSAHARRRSDGRRIGSIPGCIRARGAVPRTGRLENVEIFNRGELCVVQGLPGAPQR